MPMVRELGSVSKPWVIKNMKSTRSGKADICFVLKSRVVHGEDKTYAHLDKTAVSVEDEGPILLIMQTMQVQARSVIINRSTC